MYDWGLLRSEQLVLALMLPLILVLTTEPLQRLAGQQ